MQIRGYSGSPNETLLKHKVLKSAIQKKATRNNPLSPTANQFNRLVAKTRYKVERVFGSIKSWFRSTGACYIGLAKTHTQHVMEAMAYNLYRSPKHHIKRYLVVCQKMNKINLKSHK